MKYLEGLRTQAKVAKSKFEATGIFSQNLTKGEVRERVLANYLRPFLPSIYGLGTGQVFSSKGEMSRQIDIVIYDTVFSIALCIDEKQLLLPCESVFGSIEVKSVLDKKELDTAIHNILSLKKLERESSDSMDFTPISRLEVGNSLTYGKVKQNPYLGIVFALDGMDGKKIRDQLVQYPEDYRENLPDYVFNLSKKYMISRWMRKSPSEKPDIDCRIGPYNGFVFIPLGDDTLPVFCLTLNTILNRTRLKQPNLSEIWINTINNLGTGYEKAYWQDSK